MDSSSWVIEFLSDLNGTGYLIRLLCIALSLCEKNTHISPRMYMGNVFSLWIHREFFLDVQMRCDVSGGVDMFLKWGGNMEAIPRLMTSHQVNLCEAIITLCLDELRRIFRQQKSKPCWYVLCIRNHSRFFWELATKPHMYQVEKKLVESFQFKKIFNWETK